MIVVKANPKMKIKEKSPTCAKAIDDEVKSLDLNDKSSDDDFDDLSYEELLNDFHDLHYF